MLVKKRIYVKIIFFAGILEEKAQASRESWALWLPGPLGQKNVA
jgi:hypothetical protein